MIVLESTTMFWAYNPYIGIYTEFPPYNHPVRGIIQNYSV